MSDVGTPETSERGLFREGLLKRDRSLSVGQNISRVSGYTPELQWLGAAIVGGDEAELKEAVKRASESMERNYNLRLVFKPEAKVVKMTGNSDNKVTSRGRDIIVSDSLVHYPWMLAAELSHELGVIRLMLIYGSKRNIPHGLPNPDGGKDLTAAHYLDWYVQSGGKDKDPIDTARQYYWQAGRLIMKV